MMMWESLEEGGGYAKTLRQIHKYKDGGGCAYHNTQGSDSFAIRLDGADIADIII